MLNYSFYVWVLELHGYVTSSGENTILGVHKDTYVIRVSVTGAALFGKGLNKYFSILSSQNVIKILEELYFFLNLNGQSPVA